MCLAPIYVLCSRGVSLVRPAEIGKMNLFEGVTVFYGSNIDKAPVIICHNLSQRLWSDSGANEVHWKFSTGEESYISSEDVRRRREGRRREWCSEDGSKLAEFGNDQVVCWRKSIVLAPKSEGLFLKIPEVFDVAGYEPDVSAQLSVFAVSGNPPLIAGSAESQGGEQHGESLKPRRLALLRSGGLSMSEESGDPFTPGLLSVFSAMSLIVGTWIGVIGTWRGHWPVSAGLVALGWLGQTNYPLVNLFFEGFPCF